MTKRIQEPVMDDRDFDMDDGYSRLDHMDGLGMRPGMIRGPLTGLPIPAPDLEETLVDAAKLAVIAGIIGGFIVLAAVALVIGSFLNGVLR